MGGSTQKVTDANPLLKGYFYFKKPEKINQGLLTPLIIKTKYFLERGHH
jgi:hypothetical protein